MDDVLLIELCFASFSAPKRNFLIMKAEDAAGNGKDQQCEFNCEQLPKRIFKSNDRDLEQENNNKKR